MIKVGLSGNRFSGKNSISKLFKQINIPVFEADIVLKFILSHSLSVIDELKKILPPHYFENGFIKLSEVKDATTFDMIVNCAEYELMKAYESFNKKNPHAIYTIFKSSILFERTWSDKMDYNISVFCPKKWRIERCKHTSGMKYQNIETFLSKEIDDYRKNSMSDFIIHNYYGQDPLNQVNEIDTKIINKYLTSHYTQIKEKGQKIPTQSQILSTHY